MKDSRRAHSRQSYSAESHSEQLQDEHVFKNPIAKWYKQRKRNKDDETQLLDADIETSQHINDVPCSTSAPGTCSTEQSTANSGTRAEMPHQRRQRPLPGKPDSNTAEDLSTKKRAAINKGNKQVRQTGPQAALGPRQSVPNSRPKKLPKLSPADRARMAFPAYREREYAAVQQGSGVDNSGGQALAMCSGGGDEKECVRVELKPSDVRSLGTILGDVCSGGCNLNMKVRGKQRANSSPRKKTTQEESSNAKAVERILSSSNFPTSIEVLMTVKHSYSLPQPSRPKHMRRDVSNISIVSNKRSKDVISIPKSKFIVVSALLLFIIVLCFAVTVYSYSTANASAAFRRNSSCIYLPRGIRTIKSNALDNVKDLVQARKKGCLTAKCFHKCATTWRSRCQVSSMERVLYHCLPPLTSPPAERT